MIIIVGTEPSDGSTVHPVVTVRFDIDSDIPITSWRATVDEQNVLEGRLTFDTRCSALFIKFAPHCALAQGLRTIAIEVENEGGESASHQIQLDVVSPEYEEALAQASAMDQMMAAAKSTFGINRPTYTYADFLRAFFSSQTMSSSELADFLESIVDDYALSPFKTDEEKAAFADSMSQAIAEANAGNLVQGSMWDLTALKLLKLDFKREYDLTRDLIRAQLEEEVALGFPLVDEQPPAPVSATVETTTATPGDNEDCRRKANDIDDWVRTEIEKENERWDNEFDSLLAELRRRSRAIRDREQELEDEYSDKLEQCRIDLLQDRRDCDAEKRRCWAQCWVDCVGAPGGAGGYLLCVILCYNDVCKPAWVQCLIDAALRCAECECLAEKNRASRYLNEICPLKKEYNEHLCEMRNRERNHRRIIRDIYIEGNARLDALPPECQPGWRFRVPDEVEPDEDCSLMEGCSQSEIDHWTPIANQNCDFGAPPR